MYKFNIFVIMKRFLNYSKLVLSSLVATTAFVACSDDDIAEYSTQYTANIDNIKVVGEAVDLGLPSGTKWASMNVGAKDSTDNGILFIWGDVTGTKLLPSSNSYSVNAQNAESLFEKYKGDAKVGYVYNTTNKVKLEFGTLTALDSAYVDSLTIIKQKEYEGMGKFVAKIADGVFTIDLVDSTEVKYFASNLGGYSDDKGATVSDAAVCDLIGNASYDPATANWGAAWQMPTKAQLQELIDKCTWEFVGNGYKVIGPNENSIFLPAAGYRYGEKSIGSGNAGYYASGQILCTYAYPSFMQQVDGSKGEISNIESTPNILIFQHGQFENSCKIYNNLTTNYGISVRPVAK